MAPDERDKGDDRPYRIYRAGEDEPRESKRREREQSRERDRARDADPPAGRPDPGEGAGERESEGDPGYQVYRSRKGPVGRLRPRNQADQMRELARGIRRRGKGDDPDKPKKRWSAGRVLKWVAIAVAAWIGLSVVLFFVSAQFTEGVGDKAEDALSPGGSLLTGSTILVIGSDERAGVAGSRADSIMLLRTSFGSVRRLSILRDSLAEIPGHDTQKINAAYALGGTALMIETVEKFMGNGLKVNHVIEVNFKNFPEFIDALGGIDIKLENCVRSNGFAGTVISLKKGEHHLSGYKALKFSRVRHNECDPSEDDKDRARRQQLVFSGIRDQALSPSTFFRLPWVSWQAPRAIRSDLKGPGLAALFSDLMTGGSGKTRVLKPSAAGPLGSLVVSEEEKAKAVDELLGR